MKNLIILTILLTSSVMVYTQSTKDIESITNFDAERYLGTWYEIARLDHPFERGLDYVTATYIDKGNGKITVLNKGVKQDGTQSEATGKAYIKKSDNKQGELRVSFFLFFYAKYRIIYLDRDYQTAVVCGSNRNYLWILSRNPKLEKTELDELIEFCKKNGFETDKLIFPKQK
jgi:apolipoprotein D and lipocalin family protein